MKSAECLVVGFVRYLINRITATQKAFRSERLLMLEERLRAEPRGRAIVVVGIGHMLRVKVDLVVVEVEVRSVVEGIVPIIGNMPVSIPSTGGRGLRSCDLYPP